MKCQLHMHFNSTTLLSRWINKIPFDPTVTAGRCTACCIFLELPQHLMWIAAPRLCSVCAAAGWCSAERRWSDSSTAAASATAMTRRMIWCLGCASMLWGFPSHTAPSSTRLYKYSHKSFYSPPTKKTLLTNINWTFTFLGEKFLSGFEINNDLRIHCRSKRADHTAGFLDSDWNINHSDSWKWRVCCSNALHVHTGFFLTFSS